MDEATLGLEDSYNGRFSLFESFTAALESFERNLKDEFARRAAKNREILIELQVLREDSSAFRERQTQDNRHKASPEVKVGVLRRQSVPHTDEPEDRDWHEEYRKLSEKHGKLRSERDELSTALEALKDRRKKDAETIRRWQDREDRPPRRSSSKESEQPPKHPKSGSSIPSKDPRRSPLSEFEISPGIHTEIPGNEPLHATPQSDPPEPFEELNCELGSSERTALRLLAPQHIHRNDDHEPPELPPVRLIRNGRAEPLRIVNANDRLPPPSVRDLQQKPDTPSSISTSSLSSQPDGMGEDTTLIGITSDTPVVVFARSVGRKRRRTSSDRENVELIKSDLGCGSPGNPLRVKSEHGSSSPLLSKVQPPEANNSQALDLDDVQSKVPTPKKLNRVGPQFYVEDDLHSSTALYIWRSHARATSAPASNAASQSQREQLELDPLHPPQAPNSTSALQPTDKNQKLLASSPNGRANRKAKRQKHDQSRDAAAVPLISEDGDISDDFDGLTIRRAKLLNPSTNAAKNIANPERIGVKEKSKGRLDTLLDHPSTGRGPMTPLVPSSAKQQNPRTRATIGPRTTASVSRKRPEASGSVSTGLRDLPTTPVASHLGGFMMVNNPVTTSNQHSRNSSRSSRATDSAAGSKTRSTPLRTLPLERLSTDNFKINPARNKGVAYAYAEVVRGKDQRKCLPGCTRPDCCGAHFRRLVEMSGLEVRAHQSLWDPEGEDEAIRLVMEYMQWDRARVEELGEDERERLLVDARIQKAANMFGKHRHLHERPASPPGFWNTDFPSTQEHNQNRVLADEMEREKVEVRWREAMKPKGLWKFADE